MSAAGIKKENDKQTLFVILVCTIAGLGGFLFGFDSSVIADTKDQITTQFFLSDFQWSLIVSISLLGSIVGIPISGFFAADKISRKNLLMISALGFAVGSIVCAEATQPWILLLGRFFIGICIGIASYAAPLFISEVAPPAMRGGMILINGVAITFGQAFSFLTGYFLHDSSTSSWRLILWVGVVPAVLLLLGMQFVPHSPRWMLATHGIKKARTILLKIRGEADVETELRDIQFSISHMQYRSTFPHLLSKPFIYVLIIGTVLGVFQQFSGISAIMYYGPVIFEELGFQPVKTAILATFLMGMVNCVFTIITLLMVDKIGRRSLLLGGTLIAALSLIVAGACYDLTWIGKKWLLLFFLSTYVMGYCISLGSLFWVMIAEIYPLKIRGLAMSVASMVQWIANFIVSISVLSIFHYLHEAKTFWLFGSVCLIAYLFIYYFIPETSGVTLEKIEQNLLAGKKMRELGAAITALDVTPGALAAENPPSI